MRQGDTAAVTMAAPTPAMISFVFNLIRLGRTASTGSPCRSVLDERRRRSQSGKPEA